MSTFDAKKMKAKKVTTKLGGKSVKLGDKTTLKVAASGKSTREVLQALKQLGKLKLDMFKYATD